MKHRMSHFLGFLISIYFTTVISVSFLSVFLAFDSNIIVFRLHAEHSYVFHDSFAIFPLILTHDIIFSSSFATFLFLHSTSSICFVLALCIFYIFVYHSTLYLHRQQKG